MKIVIDGVPCAQKRMKSSGKNGFVRIYDPSAKDKIHIRAEIKKQADLELFDHPKVSFVFYMPIPASVTKKQRLSQEQEIVRHEKKPDVDNLIKLYLDCLDGILFEGDQKVSLGNCIKLYSPRPRTVILLEETTENVSLQELDVLVRDLIFSARSSLEIPFPHE